MTNKSGILRKIGYSLIAGLALILLTTVISFAQTDSSCTPNNNTFRNGIDLNDCPNGTTAPTFNAYRNFEEIQTDGSVRVFDERDFLKVVKFGSTERVNQASANVGDKFRFIGYVHNDCNPELNNGGNGQCVARDARTFIRQFTEQNQKFATDSKRNHIISQTIQADNTAPRSVSDSARISSATNKSIILEYIDGSAKFANQKNQNTQYPLFARQFFGNGAELTSANSNGNNIGNNDIFGSTDYINYVFFDVIVKDAPDIPEEVCEDLELFDITTNNDRSVSFSHSTDPASFNNQVLVQVTQGPGTLSAEGRNRFRLSEFNNNTEVTAFVPDTPQCRAILDANDFPPGSGACEDISLVPRGFNPFEPSTKFTAEATPSDYRDYDWTVEGDTTDVGITFSADRTMATFTNLGPDNVVRVFATGEVNPGATCEAEAASELPPEGEYCIDATLSPKHFPANGDRREFTFEYFPANYEGEFVWRTIPAGVGTFADGDKIGNPIRTNARRVVFRGGQPDTQVVVQATDPAFAAACSDRAFSGNFPGDEDDSLIKAASTQTAGPGDIVDYQITYKYDPFFGQQNTVTILDTIGTQGYVPGTRGGRINAVAGSERINIPQCGSPTESNCYLGSIFSPDGVTLQNFTSTNPVTIRYQGKVDTVIDPTLCENLNNGFCGEEFVNETFNTQNHASAHVITVLCPAFRSYGFGDLLLEDSFKGGIDTRQCGGRPNTEGIILTPDTPTDNGIVSTGGEDVILPTHGACREANVAGFENISSALCEIQAKLSENLSTKPLATVARNTDLVCKNAITRNEVVLRNGTTAEFKQYANPNNPNELVICANTIKTEGPLTIEHDGPVTLVAENEIIINGDISYSSNTGITPGLVAIAKKSMTTNNTRLLSGIYITLPSKVDGKFRAMTIHIDPARPKSPFEVIGSLIGASFEVKESNFNIIYDLGRFLITEPSVLNDALDFVQEVTVNQ